MPTKTSKLNRGARLLGTLLLLGLLLGMVLWLGVAATDRLRTAFQPPPPEPVAPRAVATMTITPQTFQQWQRYPGTIAAQEEAVISSRLSAPIKEMLHRAGEQVNQGDLLVLLDDEEWRRELARLEFQAEAAAAELRLARQQLARREELHREGATTREALEESQARVQALTASLAANHQAREVAATRLAYTRLRAPFSGTIGQLYALPGDLAGQGQPLLELINITHLQAEFVVPQNDLPHFASGRPVRVTVPGSDGEWHGFLDRLHPDHKPPGRGARAEVLLPPKARQGHDDGRTDAPSSTLRPGMTASVRVLVYQREHALVIPEAALERRHDQPRVYVVEAGQARHRPVRVGPAADGWVVIEQGLRAGEQLITTAYPDLTDGEPVRAMQAAADGAL